MTVITDASIRKLKGASELPFDMVYVDQLEKFNTGQSSFKVPIEQIAPTLEKQDFDIFHVHNLMPLLLSSMMRRVIRCPIVFTFYNTPNLEERAIGYFDSPTLDMALARNIVESSPYNLAIATSKCYYDFAIRLGMPKEKVRLCYLGIEQMDVAPVTMDAARQASKKYFGDQLME